MAGALFSLLVWSGSFFAAVLVEEPVRFADPNLKAAVEDVLWVSDPTPTDMLGLTSLSAAQLRISDLTGLEYATNLQVLYLRLNYIRDISPLAGLTNLEELVLHRNWVSDLSPLAGLTRLTALNLDENAVRDISPLAGLGSLADLNLSYNQIEDVSPLIGLTSLRSLDLRYNSLSDASYDVYIPQIVANNPGLVIQHDHGPFRLTISCGPGGSVVQPGVGEFVISDGNPIAIQAVPNAGFVFACWSGTLCSNQNPLLLKLDQDCVITAKFESVSHILYVDDDAPGDPQPSDSTVSDPQENGSQEHPFDAVQKAIDVAPQGATIFVRPGTYREHIDFLSRNIRLRGFDPADPTIQGYPVLDGGNSGPVLVATGLQDANCMVEGFVIMKGKNYGGAAIICTNSSPSFVHCLIVGNRSPTAPGAVVSCTNSCATFVSCTLADNYTGFSGAAFHLVDSNITVINSIVRNNGVCSINAENSTASVQYGDIDGGWPLAGDQDCDPAFVQNGRWVDQSNAALTVQSSAFNATWAMGDYHLKSQAGRWDSQTGSWVQDGVTSPCIDAGDPTWSVGPEPAPNGGIIDLGAYGGTSQASKSLVSP